MASEHLDVLIVGAGISGIAAAYYLQEKCPNKSYAILEGRSDLGGTWDLFRYPGIRSDTDMYSLGYSFNPWTDPKAIADGASIKEYLRTTAHAHGIDTKIRFGYRVRRASWSSAEAMWTVEAENAANGELLRLNCNFLMMCTGYYDYTNGYTPDLPGQESYQGRMVHPQKWTADVDYSGKRVVVIGSGATAITLVPALAETADHVTMLQRSPSYVINFPTVDPIGHALRRVLPRRITSGLLRWRSIILGTWVYQWCKKNPEKARAWFLKQVRNELGEEYDVDTNFSPKYAPWDQRVCVTADGTFFKAISTGKATVVTDEIESFTEHGVLLRSGAELEADMVVTATGLNMQFLSNLEVTVDGEPIAMNQTMLYKGTMFSGVPNLALVIGYANAAWTLKAELAGRYVCRLLKRMEKSGTVKVVARLTDPTIEPETQFGLSAGYVLRAADQFPRQGTKKPWRLDHSYIRDMITLRFRGIDDGTLEFSGASPALSEPVLSSSVPG